MNESDYRTYTPEQLENLQTAWQDIAKDPERATRYQELVKMYEGGCGDGLAVALAGVLERPLFVISDRVVCKPEDLTSEATYSVFVDLDDEHFLGISGLVEKTEVGGYQDTLTISVEDFTRTLNYDEFHLDNIVEMAGADLQGIGLWSIVQALRGPTRPEPRPPALGPAA